MVYQNIEQRAAEALKPLQQRLAEVLSQLATVVAAIPQEDSKRKEAELQEDAKRLKRERSVIQNQIYAVEQDVFRNLLAEEYGLERTHPKFDKAYSMAYSHGHNSGYNDVECMFSELAELLKD